MKARILVADDSSLVARTVAALATRFGHHITACVSSGAGAVEAARQEPPDLALIDLHMGGELSGVDAAMTLIDQGVRVVFLTALPTKLGDEVAARAGAHGLMAKPFGTREFRDGVEAGLGWPAQRRSEVTALTVS